MEAKILNLAEALRLYNLYAPTLEKYNTAYELTINNAEVLAEAANILTGISVDEIDKMSISEIVPVMVKGLEMNEIFSMSSAFKLLGVG